FVIQKARHDQKVYALPFSCQLVRSGRRSLSVLYLRRCPGWHLWSLGTFLNDYPTAIAHMARMTAVSFMFPLAVAA
ncbi:hypothetical protein, partial [Collinsella aerofaciens]|uniref:hypothetical protein n=1 Tax=Collinsella aerofaciens TaxID=74426 RepID=UPI00359C8AE6